VVQRRQRRLAEAGAPGADALQANSLNHQATRGVEGSIGVEPPTNVAVVAAVEPDDGVVDAVERYDVASLELQALLLLQVEGPGRGRRRHARDGRASQVR